MAGIISDFRPLLKNWTFVIQRCSEKASLLNKESTQTWFKCISWGWKIMKCRCCCIRWMVTVSVGHMSWICLGWIWRILIVVIIWLSIVKNDIYLVVISIPWSNFRIELQPNAKRLITIRTYWKVNSILCSVWGIITGVCILYVLLCIRFCLLPSTKAARASAQTAFFLKFMVWFWINCPIMAFTWLSQATTLFLKTQNKKKKLDFYIG